jgi:3-oxoacyl-[acyl-carrier protein] reductase
MITYKSNAAAAQAVIEDLRASGIRVTAVQCDIVMDPERAVTESVREFGRLDIVVSNAGVPSSGTSVADTPRSVLEASLGVHAVGPHQLIRAALPELRKHSRSDIVFVSSAATSTFRPGAAIYAMGKAAQEALAHTLAREERANGVHVNIVAPGMVDAGMGRKALARHGVDYARAAPFGRLCSAADIANVVAFLVSNAGAYVNDQRIVVDGGSFDLPWTSKAAVAPTSQPAGAPLPADY